jgi:putative transposase
LLEVSRAAYYAQRAGSISARQRADEQLAEHIRQAHQASKGRYGAPRIHAELRRRGHRHARKRVARLMRVAGLRGRTPRRWQPTTIPDPAAATRADLIRRDFTVNAAAVNTRWCGDITYIPTWEGWLYLAANVHSRLDVTPTRQAMAISDLGSITAWAHAGSGRAASQLWKIQESCR